jgi:hypothetical protein
MKAGAPLVRDDLGRGRVRILNTSKARALPGRECGRAERGSGRQDYRNALAGRLDSSRLT